MRRGLMVLCYLVALGAAPAFAADEPDTADVGPSLEYRPPRPILPEPRGATPAPPVTIFRDIIGGFGIGRGSFDKPADVAIGNDGRTYVLDAGNNRIQMFNKKNDFVLEWGSQGDDQWGQFKNPTAIFVVPGTCDVVLVLDTGNNRLQWFSVPCTGDPGEKLPNLPLGHAGSYIRNGDLFGDYGIADGKFDKPLDLTFVKSNVARFPFGLLIVSTFWLLDAGNERVQQCSFTIDPRSPWEMACSEVFSNLTGDRGSLKGLVSLAWSHEESFDYLYLLGTGCSIQKFKFTAGNLEDFRRKLPVLDETWPAVAPESGLCVPARVRYDERKQYLYVLDSGNSLLSIFHRNGNYISALRGAARTFDRPGGFAFRPESGDFAVADTGNDLVQKFTLR
ncbi:MAG TPA: hypothetical protein VN317_02695 [Candidatus Methanoperedens sp.]|nr:hypothetical protein [Candidatus Methanoperedens sp.]